MSEKSMKAALQVIKARLVAAGKWDDEVIDTIIQSLLNEENWPMFKVCAYLDVLDLKDRT